MPSLLRLSIRQPDGQTNELTVDAQRVLVGSGAQCEVRLGPDVADAEHLVVLVHEGVVYAQVTSQRGGVKLSGVPFMKGRVDPGSVLTIGQVQLEVALVDRAAEKKKSSAAAYAVVVMLFGVICFALLKKKGADSAIPPAPKAPDLFTATAAVCPQKARESAQRLGADLTSLAESKRERSPFYPQSGVVAVPLYRQAAACMTTAGDARSAAILSQEADALSRRVNDAFTVSRLRLERAIKSQDWETMYQEVVSQKSFISVPAPAYTTWLNEVEHRSTIKLAKLAAKKKGKKLL
jgi:hypothetical protein